MQIVSYRGPSQPGGVASILEHANNQFPESAWWHIKDNSIQTISWHKKSTVAAIPPEITEGHYRYCNELLWPLMHGNSQVARYVEADRNCYRSLNLTLAAHLNWNERSVPIFGQDYQFALLPSYLTFAKSSKSLYFWHIPWPESFPAEFESHIAEVARGLLRCGSLGFHTAGYVRNFSEFVMRHLPEFRVMSDGVTIVSRNGHVCTLVSSPAGIDYGFWENAARTVPNAGVPDIPFILSVDRADYTKGIAERIEAIKQVFRRQESLKGKLQFVFICQRTRPGIAAYDEYWERCQRLYQEALEELSTPDWSPINWITHSVSPERLAGYYSQATSMLVNPSKDGLNLTAKEFVASAALTNASLILSTGAGAWQELRNNVISIEACNPDDICASILQSLQEPTSMRRLNMHALKHIVRANSFDTWWERLTRNQNNSAVSGTRVSA
jgi:trehalose 6-phosphate synthase/phosphatase